MSYTDDAQFSGNGIALESFRNEMTFEISRKINTSLTERANPAILYIIIMNCVFSLRITRQKPKVRLNRSV